MGLNKIRNGQILETRFFETEDEEKMTVEECRMYMKKLEKEIRELKKAGK